MIDRHSTESGGQGEVTTTTSSSGAPQQHPNIISSLLCCPCKFCFMRNSNNQQNNTFPQPQTTTQKSSFKRFSIKSSKKSSVSKENQSIFQIVISQLKDLDESQRQLPTVQTVEEFSDSFDAVMNCSYGRILFREFLKSEYSEENYLFWTAVEDLKKLKNIPHSEKQIEEKAKEIYEDFISILSPKEVSLDSRTREQIDKKMVSPNVGIFDAAALETYLLMSRDSWPRFINSSLYKSFLGDVQNFEMENN